MLRKVLKILVGLFLLLVLGVVGYLLFRENHFKTVDEVKAVALLPESKIMTWEGKEAHYIEAGEGENILLIHGLGGSAHDFKDLFYMLQEDYHVVAVDLPGFGLSDAPDMSVYENPDYVGEYHKFFDAFFKETLLDTFHLVGNSMGGWVSWELAAELKSRVKTLTLLAPAGYEIVKISSKNTGWLKSLPAKILFAKGFPPSIALRNAQMCYADTSKINKYNSTTIRYNLMNKIGNLDWMIEIGNSGQLADTSKIATIETPTWVVWGTEDQIIPVEHAAYFERDLLNGRVSIYENCGHVPQMEMTERLYDDLMNFYDNIELENTVLLTN